MRMLRLIVGVLVVAGCVDSSTGTGTGGDTSGVSNTDPSGNWNATQFTYTSKADATVKVDLILQGKSVSLTIGPNAKVAGLGTAATMSTLGDSITFKGPDSTVTAAGHFSRNGNSMTLDVSGKDITYDFNNDTVKDPALLHAVLVTSAH